MRTIVDLNEELLREATRRAADEGVTLRRVFEAALRQYLQRPGAGRRYGLRWCPERGRLQPGVSLDDRDALFDLMDGRG